MDVFSHAAFGATLAILVTGEKDTAILVQGAILGTIPDILGAPVTEGYHLSKLNLSQIGFEKIKRHFKVGTTHRWETLPQGIVNYYYILHSIWFAITFAVLVLLLEPSKIWYPFVFYISHPFIDIFLHKDEKNMKFKRGIRPFWPFKYSLQVFQWSEFYWWGKMPLIPLLIQFAFWGWYIFL